MQAREWPRIQAEKALLSQKDEKEQQFLFRRMTMVWVQDGAGECSPFFGG